MDMLGRIRLGLFPGGKNKVLTFSYDDNVIYDRRLIGIFNKYRIKGTFHCNSGKFDTKDHLTKKEAIEVYQGHEISCHSRTHPFLTDLPSEMILSEILEDRKCLESIAGYPVRGMSYPYGAWSQRVIDALTQAGIVYSRTINNTEWFDLPADFRLWHPTCHHKSVKMDEIIGKFLKAWCSKHMYQLYIWGHSYEFENDKNWQLIEDICGKLSGQKDVWYATNIEIYDYMTALRSLQWSADSSMVRNPSADSVWIMVDDAPVEIGGGKRMVFGK